MSDFANVTPRNAELYAATSYQNFQCVDADEFKADYRHFIQVRKLAKRWHTNGSAPIHLMVNHLVLLFNVFGDEPTVRLLILTCEQTPALYRVIKTVLTFMGRCPDWVRGVNGADIQLAEIPIDDELLAHMGQL